jgi:AAA domain
MNAVVKAIFTPRIEAMQLHVEHLFGGYLDGCHDGLIELAWTDTKPNDDGKYPLKHARLFGTDKIDELIEEAARLNSQPMCNVYIGAALRKPDTAPFGRAEDSDAYALTCGYTDQDEPGTATDAKNIYGKAKPTMIVVTGREPHTRAQMWWRLDEPCTNPSEWPALLRGMACALNGDSTVTNPSRVMRLAGTIAWPVKDGRTVEMTDIAPLKEPGQKVYAYGHLASLFPPIVENSAASSGILLPSGISYSTNSLGLSDKITDGRERYMLKTINACLIEFIGETGSCPNSQELFDIAWPQYERKVDFTRSGRGAPEFAAKCQYTITRFERGKIAGIENLDKAVEVYQNRKQARFAEPAAKPRPLDPDTGKPLPLLLSAAQFVAGFTPPEYLIDGIMQRGYLYALTARTGHGKTAVDMYISQAIALGRPMHGKEVKAGTVLFLAGENPDDIRARFLVLADEFKFDVTTIKIRFVAGVIDVAASMPTIRAEAATIDDLVLVIVDTAAAYFPGDDSNNNSQQGAYARLLRQLTFLPGLPAVLVNCHPIKNASRDNLLPMGGSAFLNEIDGNLTLWANADRQTILHWLGKFRGPEFEPITFEMETVESELVKDAKGRKMPSVVAKPVSEMRIQFAEQRQEREEDTLLRFIAKNPKASMNDLAIKCNFISPAGNPLKAKVFRMCAALVDDKLLEKRGHRYRITAKGRKEINLDGETIGT